ncbi:hypothetical protein CYY_006461 [Polysphondylium violaceum]|uniref:SH3 domain-containing protein n=1 Tax=Polysphondylium violaceum TaxID=133409 RepID=A0A8J4PS67_9MYCE|nr:hypothetical protein CYY_006461 [Polysphondylium violaceum]
MEDNQGEEGDGEEYYHQNDQGYFDPIWVKALYDYDAANESEISFKENDVVCITQDYGDGWWCGDLNGQVGRVPANYFEYIDYNQQDQQYYDDDGNQQQQYQDGQQYDNYDDQQQQYDDSQYQEQQYDDNQYQEQQDQQQQQQYENDIYEQERKEKLRKKREDAKQEMRGLQDNLKVQNENKEKLSAEIELLTKDSDRLEDEIRLLKLLKFMKLEIIKTEYDFDIDSDISTQSRQMGIQITSDIKAIRAILAGIKSSSADQPKKQFDSKLEDIEKKFINNLNLLGACDILKKSLFLSLTQLETIISPPNTPQSTHPAYSSNATPTLMSPPPPLVIPPTTISSSTTTTTNTSSSGTTGNDSAQLYTPATSSTPNPFFSAPSTILSDKDKRKSIKEAKKIEKLERKEEKKLEKMEKKEKKKDDSFGDSPVWKPASKK